MSQRLQQILVLISLLMSGCDAMRSVFNQNDKTSAKQTHLSTNPENGAENIPPAENANRPLKAGFDQEGRERSCQEMLPDTACTMSFEPGDQFGADCREAGHEAIQCGCHDYICSAKLKN